MTPNFKSPKVSELFDLRERRLQPEIMDDPDLDASRHQQALRGLSRLNWAGNNAGLIWPALAELSRRVERPIRVLDVATGAGDVPHALARRAKRAGVRATFAGCDVSERAIDFARQKAILADVTIEFFRLDVLQGELPTGYDAVICSLFLHHLQRDDAYNLVRRMAQASRHLLLVSDLNRTRATMLMTYVASHLLTRSDVVHVDGPLSVQAAYTVSEARTLAEDAGLEDCTVRPAWPCRFLMTWWRPEKGDE